MKLALVNSGVRKQSFEDAVLKLCEVLRPQMELLDDLRPGVKSESFLKRIASSFKKLDAGYVKACIARYEADGLFNEVLNGLVRSGEIDIKGNIMTGQYEDACHIFSKRGAPKSMVDRASDQRRISFASTKFYDGDVLLTVGALREMSDLEYLFSLNGYYVPFCESTRQRSMYESFFGAFLKVIEGLDLPGKASFNALKEIIVATSVITELCVDALECIFEIITVINTRVKAFNSGSQLRTSGSPSGSPRSRSEEHEMQNEVPKLLLEVMNDPDKVFHLFKCRKLLKSVNSNGVEIAWLAKVNNYAAALEEALELYQVNCEAFKRMSQDLAAKSDGDVRALANDFTIYVSEFQRFVDLLKLKDGPYNSTLRSGRDLLAQLDAIEMQSPVKYGGIASPRTKSPGLSGLLSALSPRQNKK